MGFFLSGAPPPAEETSQESQHREDEEDEEEDLRPQHEFTRDKSEAEDGGDQGDDEECDTQTEE
jgi:hypothetical protein